MLAERKKPSAKAVRREIDSLTNSIDKLSEKLDELNPVIEDRLLFFEIRARTYKNRVLDDLKHLRAAFKRYDQPKGSAGAKTGDYEFLIYGIARILYEHEKPVEQYGKLFNEVCALVFEDIGESIDSVPQAIKNAWGGVEDMLDGSEGKWDEYL